MTKIGWELPKRFYLIRYMIVLYLSSLCRIQKNIILSKLNNFYNFYTNTRKLHRRQKQWLFQKTHYASIIRIAIYNWGMCLYSLKTPFWNYIHSNWVNLGLKNNPFEEYCKHTVLQWRG